MPQELHRDGPDHEADDDGHDARPPTRAGRAETRRGVDGTICVTSHTVHDTRIDSITPGIAMPESLSA